MTAGEPLTSGPASVSPLVQQEHRTPSHELYGLLGVLTGWDSREAAIRKEAIWSPRSASETAGTPSSFEGRAWPVAQGTPVSPGWMREPTLHVSSPQAPAGPEGCVSPHKSPPGSTRKPDKRQKLRAQWHQL